MNNRALIQEALRRRRIVEACFPKQQDPVRGALERGETKIAILTSRRAGKTNAVLRAICRDALDNPKCRYAYIGLSRLTSETIVWKELEFINEAHNLGLEMQGYRLRAIFPNGAELTLHGADQTGWLKKFRGAKYRGVVIDEAGEYDIDLREFISMIIEPTLVDLSGTLWLIGTPGPVPNGYWWDVTNPDPEKRRKGWNFYSWHTFDNPHVDEQFRKRIETLREEYGEELEGLPWFQREYLGKWVTDTTNNVYDYKPDRNNTYDWLPHHADQYILGVDPGFSDAAAFVVGCYNTERSDQLIFIDCFKQPGMLLDEMADKVEEFMQVYPGLRIIGDPSAAHFLAELRTRRSIPVEDAKKQKKEQAIRVMNNYLARGKIKFLQPQTAQYAKEIVELKKAFRKSEEHEEDGVKMGSWVENPKQPNHFCDAGLYIARAALSWTYEEPIAKIQYGTDEYYDSVSEKLKRQAFKKAKGDQPWWRSL